MRRLARVYWVEAKLGFQSQIHYRFATAFALIGFVIEPIVYLVVWTTISEAQGGSIAGFSTDDFIAYYIAWTLVRAMNISLTPYVWDGRIQRGRINDHLTIPLHMFHRDLAWFAGWKPLWIAWWIPLATGLIVVFQPAIRPEPWQIAAFMVAVWTAFVLRFIILYLLGLISFWTTRASALFEIVVTAEILLSGRLVPLDLMPESVQTISLWLPFRWTYQAPIEIAIGRTDAIGTLSVFAAQLAWSTVLGGILAITWRQAMKRYSAVGA